MYVKPRSHFCATWRDRNREHALARKGALILKLLIAGTCFAHAQQTSHDLSGVKRPAWTHNGVVFVGSWEPLPWLYRKNVQNNDTALSGASAAEQYRQERSEETIAGLKAIGVNMFLTSFHKGFGIANEEQTMNEARTLGTLLHKHGKKLGVYVSALLLYEELIKSFLNHATGIELNPMARRTLTAETVTAIAPF